MSKRAIEFVEEWILENVNADVYLAEKGDPRPKEFADLCLAAAKAKGISRKEVAEEFDLVDRMARAITDEADTEVERSVAKDRS